MLALDFTNLKSKNRHITTCLKGVLKLLILILISSNYTAEAAGKKCNIITNKCDNLGTGKTCLTDLECSICDPRNPSCPNCKGECDYITKPVCQREVEDYLNIKLEIEVLTQTLESSEKELESLRIALTKINSEVYRHELALNSLKEQYRQICSTDSGYHFCVKNGKVTSQSDGQPVFHFLLQAASGVIPCGELAFTIYATLPAGDVLSTVSTTAKAIDSLSAQGIKNSTIKVGTSSGVIQEATTLCAEQVAKGTILVSKSALVGKNAAKAVNCLNITPLGAAITAGFAAKDFIANYNLHSCGFFSTSLDKKLGCDGHEYSNYPNSTEFYDYLTPPSSSIAGSPCNKKDDGSCEYCTFRPDRHRGLPECKSKFKSLSQLIRESENELAEALTIKNDIAPKYAAALSKNQKLKEQKLDAENRLEQAKKRLNLCELRKDRELCEQSGSRWISYLCGDIRPKDAKFCGEPLKLGTPRKCHFHKRGKETISCGRCPNGHYCSGLGVAKEHGGDGLGSKENPFTSPPNGICRLDPEIALDSTCTGLAICLPGVERQNVVYPATGQNYDCYSWRLNNGLPVSNGGSPNNPKYKELLNICKAKYPGYF